MSERYIIINGSESSHCCFEYTIIDTSKGKWGGENNDKWWKESVCECFTKEDAELICKALNEKSNYEKA